MGPTILAARVVILTALDVEYQAVLGHLTGVTTSPHPAGTLFEVGALRQSSCRVAVGLTGRGNTSAAVVAERAIATFRPKALFFTGIAGALHDDLALGDVVFATKVYAYHGGLADDHGFQDRKSTRLNSSHITISYAVFCLKKKKKKKNENYNKKHNNTNKKK